MQGFSVLKTIFDFLIDTGLVKQVYHTVEIIEESSKERFPAYPVGDNIEYVGVDDTKIMNVYCRQIDDMKPIKTEKVGGCSNIQIYTCVIPHRIVFFNDYEQKNVDDLLNKFIQFVFLPRVKLIRVITDKEKLLQLESRPENFKLVETSFYCAIDFEITLPLQKTDCEVEIGCSNICNPYTKT